MSSSSSKAFFVAISSGLVLFMISKAAKAKEFYDQYSLSLKGISLSKKTSLTKLVLDLKVALHNPTPFEASAGKFRLVCNIIYNGTALSSFDLNQTLSIKPFSDTPLAFPLEITSVQSVKLLFNLLTQKQKPDSKIQLKGYMIVNGINIPVDTFYPISLKN
jgi:hypothetical protein